MGRLADGVAQFHRSRWASWLDLAIESTDLTSSRLARQVDVPTSRVSDWRRGELSVTADTAFSVGQAIAGMTKRFNLCGPFAVFGAGYIVDTVDFLRRLGIADANELFWEMRYQMRSNKPSADPNIFRSMTAIGGEDEKAFWSEPSFDGSLSAFERAWSGVLAGRDFGPRYRGSPMHKRFIAAESIMDVTRFTLNVLGMEQGHKEGMLMLDRWVQRFDRVSIHTDDELENLKSLMLQYASMLRELASAHFAKLHPEPSANDPDDADWFDPESMRGYYGVLKAFEDEAIAIEDDIARVGDGRVLMTIPNMYDNGITALPRVSDLTQELREQARGAWHYACGD